MGPPVWFGHAFARGFSSIHILHCNSILLPAAHSQQVVMDLVIGFRMKQLKEEYGSTNLTGGTIRNWMKCFSPRGRLGLEVP